MKRHSVTAAAIIIALAAPALAFAAPAKLDSDVRQIAVSYADLNINTAAGHAMLAGRVKRAAADICGQRPEVLLDVAANQRFNACMSKTVGEAMAKVPASTIVAGSTRPNG